MHNTNIDQTWTTAAQHAWVPMVIYFVLCFVFYFNITGMSIMHTYQPSDRFLMSGSWIWEPIWENIFNRDAYLQLGIFDHSDSVLLYHDISLSMVFQLKQQNRKRIKQQNRKRIKKQNRKSLKKRAKVTFVSIMPFQLFFSAIPRLGWFGGRLQFNVEFTLHKWNSKIPYNTHK